MKFIKEIMWNGSATVSLFTDSCAMIPICDQSITELYG